MHIDIDHQCLHACWASKWRLQLDLITLSALLVSSAMSAWVQLGYDTLFTVENHQFLGSGKVPSVQIVRAAWNSFIGYFVLLIVCVRTIMNTDQHYPSAHLLPLKVLNSGCLSPIKGEAFRLNMRTLCWAKVFQLISVLTERHYKDIYCAL